MSDKQQLEEKLQRILPEAKLLETALNLCPEIRLYLLDDAYPQYSLSEQQTRELMDNPPYWCFCWASGDVLARYLLDNPQVVSGKRIIDVGCGSGVAAIAAAKAGASQVWACDLDEDALLISALNSGLNEVGIRCVDDMEIPGEVDIVLLADVLYDQENFVLLEHLEQRASTMLLADSRVPDFDRPGYRMIAEFESCTWPDLDESASFRHVRLFEYRQEWVI